jgi:hypothetical protein
MKHLENPACQTKQGLQELKMWCQVDVDDTGSLDKSGIPKRQQNYEVEIVKHQQIETVNCDCCERNL